MRVDVTGHGCRVECNWATLSLPCVGYMRGLLRSKTSWKVLYGGFQKFGGTWLGVPMIRTRILWGLYWGPLFWETTIYRKKCLAAVSARVTVAMLVVVGVAAVDFCQLGGCQNSGPFLDPYYNTAPNI